MQWTVGHKSKLCLIVICIGYWSVVDFRGQAQDEVLGWCLVWITLFWEAFAQFLSSASHTKIGWQILCWGEGVQGHWNPWFFKWFHVWGLEAVMLFPNSIQSRCSRVGMEDALVCKAIKNCCFLSIVLYLSVWCLWFFPWKYFVLIGPFKSSFLVWLWDVESTSKANYYGINSLMGSNGSRSSSYTLMTLSMRVGLALGSLLCMQIFW